MFDLFQTASFFRKLFTKKEVLFILLLIFAYFITRLINLDKLPIFGDEAIYIQWSKVAWHDATLRFISLTDGKQPLQTWGTIPFLKLFPDNLLLGGRLFAVATGFVALSGMFTLLYYLFGKKAAFWGSFFYIFTPYFLFYDRMALVDSGVNAAFIWILFFSVLLARSPRLDTALIFGFVAGFGLLAKSSTRLFLGLAALAPILFFETHYKKFISRIVNFGFLFGLSAAIAFLIYNVQRLSPYMHLVAEKNKTFLMTFDQLMTNPFQYFFRNINLIPWYILQESAYILPLLGILGLVVLYRKDRRLFIYFLLWLAIPFVMVSFVSIVLYPRYIIFMPTLLAILAAYFVSIQKTQQRTLLFVGAFTVSVLYFNYTILFSPKTIPFPPIDRAQYIEDWSAGWGIKEIVDYTRDQSKDKPVLILAEGNFGMAVHSLDSHLKRADSMELRGYWPLGEKEIMENKKELQLKKVYVVFSHTKNVPAHWNLKLIKKFEKPGNKSAVYFFEMLP